MRLFALAFNEPVLTDEERRWRRERRSAWLRLAAYVILVGNLAVREHESSGFVHLNIVATYGAATLLALGFALLRRGLSWMGTALVVVDAALVVALFHEHLLTSNKFDHDLTAPTVAIAFLLLTHVALRLIPPLVLLFSGLVVAGWLSLLTVVISAHASQTIPLSNSWSNFLIEGALAAAFAFASFVCYLLTKDHDILLRGAVASEKRRQNLARFFAPGVLAELQTKGTSLDLRQRRAAVMFVDLRSFTRFSETVPHEDLTELLQEYRQLVTQAVFQSKGTVDKFVGDGVMAVFGQPRSEPDDTARALECALHLSSSLARWKEDRARQGKPAIDAGIGLHVGPVIGGVLHSGSHDEFTVFGDAVNVAERLERLSKSLDAALVVSDAVMSESRLCKQDAPWVWKDAAELDGRNGSVRIAYLPRLRGRQQCERHPEI